MLAAQGEAKRQFAVASGERQTQQMEREKVGTLLGMAQQRKAAADQARKDATNQLVGGLTDMAGGALGAMAGGDIIKGGSGLGFLKGKGKGFNFTPTITSTPQINLPSIPGLSN